MKMKKTNGYLRINFLKGVNGMEKCLIGICEGSGLISLENGSFIKCGCMNFLKAEELFLKSFAPNGSKIFIEDLKQNPKILSVNKKRALEEESELTRDKIKEKATIDLKTLLKQFDDGKNNKPIRRFIENNYKLLFFGDTRTGKTQAAISLALEGAKRNKKFYYLSCHEVHKLFRYDFNDEEKSKEISERLKVLEGSEILIIDDLGKEIDLLANGNERDEILLKKILDFIDATLRQKNRLTIITSNLNDEDIVKKYNQYSKRLSGVLFKGNVLKYQFGKVLADLDKDEIIEDLF